MAIACCIPRALSVARQLEAAAHAIGVFPVNAPNLHPGVPMQPGYLALLTTKYWGPSARTLSVGFMEATSAPLGAKILAHMNAWSERCAIRFALTADPTADVRISRGPGGYWSYLGTDIRMVPPSQPTMNLEGFTLRTPEKEYRRVVRHEAGHTLGFPHEHMRRELVGLIDPSKAVTYFAMNCGWDALTVQQQVLTPLEDLSLLGTPADVDSIMCYQIPGELTISGEPIPGGSDIDESDYAFASRVYPPAVARDWA